MPANLSHLQLNSYFLRELNYSLKESLENVPVGPPDLATVGVEIADITNEIEGAPNEWRCELIVQSTPDEKNHYDFRIVMVGFFRVNPDLPPEIAKSIALANCPAVLFSTSREIVGTVTRRSPFPATLLPLVTFVPISTEREVKGEKKAKSARTPAKKSKSGTKTKASS